MIQKLLGQKRIWILFLFSILINKISYTQEVTYSYYDTINNVFVFQEWETQQIARDLEEKTKLIQEVEILYKVKDSLSIDRKYFILKDSLLTEKLSLMEKNSKFQEFAIDNLQTQVNNLVQHSGNADKTIKNLNQELLACKRKTWFDKVTNFGWGPFRVKYIVIGLAGYYIGQTF